MKREADGDMGSPQKRTRRGDEEVRLLIPSKVAGSIIGKGGQNITKLRSQYKASITVPDCPGPERLLSLSSDIDTICNIIRDVVPNLEENGAGVNNGNELDLRMMIHQSQAGCVIGKGGYKIKEIREKTGARIKIFSSVAPQSTDRVIQIIGEPEKCIETIREVICLIKTSPIKGPVNPYDPHYYDDFNSEDYGGWGHLGNVHRRSPGEIRQLQASAPIGRNGIRDGARPFGRTPNNNQRGSVSGSAFGGSGSQRNTGSGFGPNRPPPFEQPRNGWGGGSSNGSTFNQGPILSSNGITQGQSGLNLSQSGGSGKTTTQVTIPKDLAGAIIGKGGGRIRKIRQDSGAGITIDEPLPGSNDRIITISGSPNQIQMAQYLLQQSVHNNAERNNY